MTGQRCGTGFTCVVVITPPKQIRGNAMTPILVKTYDSSAGCGVTLEVGKKYFVAASKNAMFTIFLDLCDLYEDWTGLSQSEIDSKSNAYSQITC